MILRSLIPTWRFFEEPTDVPVLRYRVKKDVVEDGVAWSAWTTLPPAPRRNYLLNLFINPHATMALAVGSLLQHFEQELNTHKETPSQSDTAGSVTSSVSFQLIKNTVEFFLFKKSLAEAPVKELQFQILSVFQGEAIDCGTERFCSPPWAPEILTSRTGHGSVRSL